MTKTPSTPSQATQALQRAGLSNPGTHCPAEDHVLEKLGLLCRCYYLPSILNRNSTNLRIQFNLPSCASSSDSHPSLYVCTTLRLALHTHVLMVKLLRDLRGMSHIATCDRQNMRHAVSACFSCSPRCAAIHLSVPLSLRSLLPLTQVPDRPTVPFAPFVQTISTPILESSLVGSPPARLQPCPALALAGHTGPDFLSHSSTIALIVVQSIDHKPDSKKNSSHNQKGPANAKARGSHGEHLSPIRHKNTPLNRSHVCANANNNNATARRSSRLPKLHRAAPSA